MKSKEKRNFVLGSLILVLTISIGYFGISSMEDTYAAPSCDGKIINNKYCCPSALSSKVVAREGNYYCVNGNYSDSNAVFLYGGTYYLVEHGKEILQANNTNPADGLNYFSCISQGMTYSGSNKVYKWSCTAKTGVRPLAIYNTCTVYYNFNGGSGNPQLKTSITESGVLTTFKPTKDDYTFSGWSIDGKVYSSGATYTCPDSEPHTANAQWTADITCTSTYLEYGCSGSYVEELQKKLNQVQGCGVTVDGGFGTNTKNCVINFQKAFGLTTDGVAGTNTLKKLNALYSNITVSLDNAGATTKGTSSIYQLYNKGYYLDSSNSKTMSTSANKITIPSKSYSVIYDYNDGTNKKVTKNVNYKFEGYYNSNGTQYINSSGYLTSSASNKYFQSAGNLNTKWSGGSLTLDKATRNGYTFLGWSTAKTSTTASYKANQSLSVDKNITLYAVWTANTSTTKKYSVKFNANGGVGTMSDLACIVDSSCTLSANAFEKTGSIFKGWNTKKDGTGTNYSDKATVKNLATTDGGTVTLYAKWKQAGVEVNTYKVTFKYNDDVTKDKVVEVDENDTISIDLPERDGYGFDGWYTDKELTKKYDLTTKVNKDITLYAKWIGDKTDDEITNNSKTGDIMMFMAWTVGIGALAYTVYYYKTRKEN